MSLYKESSSCRYLVVKMDPFGKTTLKVGQPGLLMLAPSQ